MGSADYALPGSDFTLICGVPEEAQSVTFYRRPDLTNGVGSIQVGGDQQCYNTKLNPPDVCDPGICSCVPTSTVSRGTVFRWVIQPQSGDQGSVWFCRRTNLDLPSPTQDSLYFTLTIADGPGTSIRLSDISYTGKEGDTLPDITCTADCRPGCTFVWTKPDNTNFTASAVLSLGHLERSEHGTYKCTARNIVGESTITMSVTVQYGPRTVVVYPPDTSYTRTERETLPDITCTADCRPDCTFVWTKPDNTNFTTSAVLSLGQLERSEHGTYTCTARNDIGTSSKAITLILNFPPNIINLSYIQGGADLIEDGSKSLYCSVESYPPSTIQWYFKGSNSLLLTIDNVLESTYTLTTAGCLDTGMYTCSARNDVSSTVVTRDIPINVLWKPRLSRIPENYPTSELLLSETLTFNVMFISNPEPKFLWTYQLNPLVPATEFVNGTDNFLIQNSFQKTNLSAVSEVTRVDMQENWFGLYNVVATNNQGSTQVSFTVRLLQPPNVPIFLSVACRKDIAAEISWQDGGNSEFYQVLFSSDGFLTSKELYPVKIPYEADGSNRFMLRIDDLKGGRLYFFKVAAYNTHGNTTTNGAVGCTVRDECSCAANDMYTAGVALTCTGVLTLLLAVGLGIFISLKGTLQQIENCRRIKV